MNYLNFWQVYEDKVTGFNGKAIAFCMYQDGNNTVLLQPKVDEKGRWQKCQWINIKRLMDNHHDKDKLELGEAKPATLGTIQEDTVTGIKGMVTAFCQYEYSQEVLIEPKESEGEKSKWVDTNRL